MASPLSLGTRGPVSGRTGTPFFFRVEMTLNEQIALAAIRYVRSLAKPHAVSNQRLRELVALVEALPKR